MTPILFTCACNKVPHEVPEQDYCHGCRQRPVRVDDASECKCASWFCKELAVADSEYCARHRDN